MTANQMTIFRRSMDDWQAERKAPVLLERVVRGQNEEKTISAAKTASGKQRDQESKVCAPSCRNRRTNWRGVEEADSQQETTKHENLSAKPTDMVVEINMGMTSRGVTRPLETEGRPAIQRIAGGGEAMPSNAADEPQPRLEAKGSQQPETK